MYNGIPVLLAQWLFFFSKNKKKRSKNSHLTQYGFASYPLVLSIRPLKSLASKHVNKRKRKTKLPSRIQINSKLLYYIVPTYMHYMLCVPFSSRPKRTVWVSILFIFPVLMWLCSCFYYYYLSCFFVLFVYCCWGTRMHHDKILTDRRRTRMYNRDFKDIILP